jgi:hypothetical protein
MSHLAPGTDHLGRPIVDFHEFQWITVPSNASAAREASRIFGRRDQHGPDAAERFPATIAEFIKDEVPARASKPRTLSAEKNCLG